METLSEARFKQNYARHLQHLKLKGLQPKTIEAYSRAIRRIGDAVTVPTSVRPSRPF
jgi:hypothetical protein